MSKEHDGSTHLSKIEYLKVDDLSRDPEINVRPIDESRAKRYANDFDIDALGIISISQMVFWSRRSGKKIDTLLPIATHFVAELIRPMFDKIDTVHYTKMARILKVAQDYGVRLLMRYHDEPTARRIAERLTQAYSEHGFASDTATFGKRRALTMRGHGRPGGR